MRHIKLTGIFVAYIQINMPAPKKERLKEIAADEGIDQVATLCRRVLYLYMRDPAAFNLLLLENKKQMPKTSSVSNRVR